LPLDEDRSTDKATLSRSERRRALLESIPPRNSRLDTIDADECRGRSTDAAAGMTFQHRIDKFPMPGKTHATRCRAAASIF
jgi:hypothetical protein